MAKKRPTPSHRRQTTLVPPITVPFEEAVARLMKVKPPAKKKPVRKKRAPK